MAAIRNLTVSGHFKNLAQIADFIRDVAIQAKLTERAVYAVEMAVDEACANIIEHAYGGEGKGQIQLTCAIQDDGLQVTIADRGATFDPSQVPQLDPQAPLSKRKRRGMGIFFIQKLMDDVEYRFNTPQGNQLILFKRRDKSS
jgi:serine/threonine-protein kinase RsbW